MLLSGSDTGARQRRAAPPITRPPPRRRAPERQPEQRAWERPPEQLGGWGHGADGEGADGVGAGDWWTFVSDGHFAAAAAEGTAAARARARRCEHDNWAAVGWRRAQWSAVGLEGVPAPGGEAAALAALPGGEAAAPGQPRPPAAGGASPREGPTLAIASAHRFGPLERRARLALPPAQPSRWEPPRPAGEPGSAGTSAPPSVPSG